MGYVCPVCEDPQADGEHLANHLAFTAVLGDDAHEAWLDEHAPDWGDRDPAALAERVVDHADETDYPQVFEDTTDGHDHDPHGRHDHRHGGRDHGDDGHDHGRAPGASALDDAAPGGVADVDERLADGDVDPADVLAEARELTRERRANADGADEADAAGGDDGADGTGDETE